ncbi:MAG: potassium channel family protein [Planctomycetales bacterium]
MFVVIFVSAILVVATVAVHLGVLQAVTTLLPYLRKYPRWGVGAMILGAIVGHLVEIGLFDLGITALAASGHYGSLVGDGVRGGEAVRDHFYFSAVTFTSLGYGDVTPVGPLRVLAAVEALTGMVLIAWTASFTFFLMMKQWEIEDRLE